MKASWIRWIARRGLNPHDDLPSPRLHTSASLATVIRMATDGLGIAVWRREGFKIGWVSARPSAATTVRAAAVVRALDRYDAKALAADADRVGGGGPRGGRVRTLAISGLVVAFALVAGFVIADNFGTRTSGESVTSSGPTT